MTVQDIEAKLVEGIATITGRAAAELAVDRPFHDLGIDSLGFVEILVFVEKNFNLQLIAADLTRKDFENVRALAAYIAGRR
jgi:acyl carrier protein